ncbi:YhcN/YlaJ family sporulation lipoprotein, partial [Desulforudis sp. 1190]
NAALPADPRESSALAKRLASKAAAVPGVEDAVVVLFGTNAYVGLNMEPNQEGRTKEAEREAAMQVKRADDRIRRVLVTSDPDLVTRLNRIARGIANGRPASVFVDEFSTLNKRMTPVTR